MRAADPGGGTGGGGLVSADPALLDQFVAGAGARYALVRPSITEVDQAISRWNAAPCDPRFAVRIPPVGTSISDLAVSWESADYFVARVAGAFRRADSGGFSIGGVVYAKPSAVTQALRTAPPDYNPFHSTEANNPLLWATAVGAVCYRGGQYGGGGFITGPDGVRYPLVVPMMTIDGKVYNADDDDRAGTLNGSDPGWSTVGTYIGLTKLFSPGIGGRIAAGLVTLTGGEIDDKAAPASAYRGLLLAGAGQPGYDPDGADNEIPTAESERVEGPKDALGREVPGWEQDDDPDIGGARAALGAAPFVINTINAQEKIGDTGDVAYKLQLERNLDGRDRARLTAYHITTGDDGKPVIIPLSVAVDSHNHLQVGITQYQPTVTPKAPEAVAPGPGQTYHVLAGTKQDDSFWADPDNPTVNVYQDH